MEHVASPLHVERPERLEAIVARLRKEGLFTDVMRPEPATLAEVQRVHRPAFLHFFPPRPRRGGGAPGGGGGGGGGGPPRGRPRPAAGPPCRARLRRGVLLPEQR